MSIQLAVAGTASAEACAYRLGSGESDSSSSSSEGVRRIHREPGCDKTFIELGRAATEHPQISGLSLPMFSEETSSQTARAFYTATYKSLCRAYLDTKPANRRWHEIILDGHPCMPYYDIDITGPQKPDVRFMLSTLHQLFERMLGPVRSDDGGRLQFFESESSTADKISIHGVVRGCPAFVNSMNCGQFIKAMESLAMTERLGSLFQPDKLGNIRFVLDQNVYGRNKSMRMVGSSKFGQQRYLLPTSVERYSETLNSAAKRNGNIDFLHMRHLLNYMVQYMDPDTPLVRVIGVATSTNDMTRGVGMSTPLKRLMGKLRKHMTACTSTDIQFTSNRVFSRGDGILRIETRTTYCMFAKRVHSNHQYVLVNLDTGCCKFRCWSPTCKTGPDGRRIEHIFYLTDPYHALDAIFDALYDQTATTKRSRTAEIRESSPPFDYEAPCISRAAYLASLPTQTKPTTTLPATTTTTTTTTTYRAKRVPALVLVTTLAPGDRQQQRYII